MKIHPPRPDIPPDEPFKNCAFERKKFAQSLTTLVKDTEEPVVICVDAAWGEGKTTFARMWKADLLKKGYRSIYYDAFADDFVSDPFVAFCAEIQTFLDDERKQHRPLATHAKTFIEKATSLARVVLPKGAAMVAKGVVLASAPTGSDTESMAEAAAASAEAVTEGMLERRHSEKRALSDFATELESVGQEIRKAQDFPLLVMVDELDRCRPDYALTLIERIKHLFSVKNVTFVLLTNLSQMESQVRAVYGNDVDARNYLLKFFTITARLPKDVRDSDFNHYLKYIGILARHYDLRLPHHAERQLARLFRGYVFTLREMESFFATFKLALLSVPGRESRLLEVALFLAVLRMKVPDLFTDLLLSRVTYDDFLGRLRIAETAAPKDAADSDQHLLKCMKYLLLSEDALKEDPDNDPVALFGVPPYAYRDRRNIVPRICEVMDQFDYVS